MSRSQIAIRITSQAIANQLQSLAHSHNIRKLDKMLVRQVVRGQEWLNTLQVDVPFKVGAVAIFWLYPTTVHYNQCCQNATPFTLEFVSESSYGTVNELALLLQELR